MRFAVLFGLVSLVLGLAIMAGSGLLESIYEPMAALSGLSSVWGLWLGPAGFIVGLAAYRMGLHRQENPVLRVLATVFVFGTLYLLAGFVGPLLLNPDANQGPLLGIFVTGPLGIVNGLVVGLSWIAYDRIKGASAA